MSNTASSMASTSSEYMPLVEPIAPQQQAFERSVSFKNHRTEPIIEDLKVRLQKLEMLVTRSLSSDQELVEKTSKNIITNPLRLQGGVNKSQFFGTNHWMNTLDGAITPCIHPRYKSYTN